MCSLQYLCSFVIPLLVARAAPEIIRCGGVNSTKTGEKGCCSLECITGTKGCASKRAAMVVPAWVEICPA
ncbi:excinuclease ABC subunit UvrA [Sesbania bispinosa]|nr:excinuclease ABC subunit UvrA [Sesbania bispinosa]